MLRIKPQKLPLKVFLESFKYAPRPAVNLLVVRDDGAILLTKRKKPPFAGSWHLPGSFVLKGEALVDCVNRVAKEELGIKIEKEIGRENIQLVGAFDDIDGDPRGHVVDIVYRCKFSGGKDATDKVVLRSRIWLRQSDTAEIKFFKKLPENIGFNHRETLKKLGYV